MTRPELREAAAALVAAIDVGDGKAVDAAVARLSVGLVPVSRKEVSLLAQLVETRRREQKKRLDKQNFIPEPGKKNVTELKHQWFTDLADRLKQLAERWPE